MLGGGACMAGGHVWQGACMAGGVCMARECVWQGVGMAGRLCGRGDMHGRGAFMAGGMCVGGMHVIQSMSGRYASYWNAFLFLGIFELEKLLS